MEAIRFEHVSFAYANEKPALDDVNLAISQGEFVCVVGGNGSGKTTLAKHLNALLLPHAGAVYVFGRDTGDAKTVADVRCDVGMVFQNPDDQIVASVVEDEVAFGPSNLGVDPARLRERVDEALRRVGLAGFQKRDVSTLSGGEKQRLAIAGALAMEPRVIVLDEAGSMLDPRGRDELMRICKQLHDDGCTIVMITHSVEDVVQADRVIVMQAGRIAFDGLPQSLFADQRACANFGIDQPIATKLSCELMRRSIDVGVNLTIDSLVQALSSRGWTHTHGSTGGSPDWADRPRPWDIASNEKPVISFNNVSFDYGNQSPVRHGEKRQGDAGRKSTRRVLKDVSFVIRKGEFFGIAGHTGSGKSTLVQLCNGILRPVSGSVAVKGCNLADARKTAEARRTVGVVFQYPEHQLFAGTVKDDVAFGPRNMGFSEAEVDSHVRRALDMVQLDYDAVADRSPFSLSGGEQRRVAFAGVLAMNPEVLVLDEPMAGLDPALKASFLELIRDMRERRGLTVVMVSHDMSDLASCCDRVLILDDGEVHAIGSPACVFADAHELQALGLRAPDEYRIAQELGIPVPSHGIITVEYLADYIVR